MQYLKTNTAVRIVVGPFLDIADGLTPLTSIAVTSCTCELFHDVDTGGAAIRAALTLSDSGSDNDMVHITDDVGGYYDLELTASNVNFLGRARLSITDVATHIPVFHEFMVLPAMAYNTLVLGTDYMDSQVKAIDAAATDSVIDEVVEGSLTLRQVLRLLLAALAGKASGGGTSEITFQDYADSKPRITAIVDASGNRTTVVLDGTD
jgi:hypothetical protein